MSVLEHTPQIRAIETEYSGILFRSRLEAKWAVFFDALKTPWRYEPEAFSIAPFSEQEFYAEHTLIHPRQIPGRNYLPDFELPELNAYFEVKGTPVSDEYELQLERFGQLTGKQVLLAYGDLPAGKDADNYPMHINQCAPYWDNMFEFNRCPNCGKLGCVFGGWAHYLPCPCDAPRKGSVSPEVCAAYDAARAYRFWNPKGAR